MHLPSAPWGLPQGRERAPGWTLRFTHPSVEQVAWASAAPDRAAAVTTEDGSTQAWAWDVRADERRRVSTGSVGAEEAHILPDGSGVVWWYDEIGNERGRWMLTPFEGGEARPLFRGSHDEWMMGLSLIDGGGWPPASRPTRTTACSSRWVTELPARLPEPGPRRRRAANGRREAAGCLPTAPSCASTTPRTGTSTGSPSGSWTPAPASPRATRSTRTCGWRRWPGRPPRAPDGCCSRRSAPGSSARDLGPRRAGAARPRALRRGGSGDPTGMDLDGTASWRTTIRGKA